jgi:predicted DNA-binding protein YlxM (UPF0122 family)
MAYRIPLTEVMCIQNMQIVSLDQPSFEDIDGGVICLGDILPDERIDIEREAYRSELRDIFIKGMRLLKEKQKQVVIGIFCDGKTQKEVADDLGHSESLIGEWKDQSLRILRNYLMELGVVSRKSVQERIYSKYANDLNEPIKKAKRTIRGPYGLLFMKSKYKMFFLDNDSAGEVYE